jgi:hypothetical protein
LSRLTEVAQTSLRLRVLESEDRADVPGAERGEELRFTLEAGQALGIACPFSRQDLQRNIALKPGVARTIHHTHSATAEHRKDFVRAERAAWCERAE